MQGVTIEKATQFTQEAVGEYSEIRRKLPPTTLGLDWKRFFAMLKTSCGARNGLTAMAASGANWGSQPTRNTTGLGLSTIF